MNVLISQFSHAASGPLPLIYRCFVLAASPSVTLIVDYAERETIRTNGVAPISFQSFNDQELAQGERAEYDIGLLTLFRREYAHLLRMGKRPKSSEYRFVSYDRLWDPYD